MASPAAVTSAIIDPGPGAPRDSPCGDASMRAPWTARPAHHVATSPPTMTIVVPLTVMPRRCPVLDDACHPRRSLSGAGADLAALLVVAGFGKVGRKGCATLFDSAVLHTAGAGSPAP